jgi:hypothetical protein
VPIVKSVLRSMVRACGALAFFDPGAAGVTRTRASPAQVAESVRARGESVGHKLGPAGHALLNRAAEAVPRGPDVCKRGLDDARMATAPRAIQDPRTSTSRSIRTASA